MGCYYGLKCKSICCEFLQETTLPHFFFNIVHDWLVIGIWGRDLISVLSVIQIIVNDLIKGIFNPYLLIFFIENVKKNISIISQYRDGTGI